MSEQIILKGITWNHSRGFVPMTATAQRFSELNPNVEIVWEKRSLQQFADLSIEQLAQRYDLLVIDHPWAGFAANTRTILPFDEFLPAEFLKDQEVNTVGESYTSYNFHGQQWALPIDAATPVASSRPDLLTAHGTDKPSTYDELIELAQRGLVACPLIPIDSLMTFYTFCCSLGEDPFQNDSEVVSRETGVQALQMYRNLAQLVDPACFGYNPIKVYERMTLTDDIAYCPFAYGYSNYSRQGYARRVLHFHDMVTLDGKTNLRSTLGGTGLAVSSKGQHIDVAMKYAEYVASPVCQQGLYTDNGGQPGHLSAWTSSHPNSYTANYFSNTLPALQRAFLRPRYNGSLYFQDHGGDIVRNYLMNGGSEVEVLNQLDKLYQQSKDKRNMVKPLDGLVVLEFSQFMAGPTAGLRLADLGARVIKIERPVKGEAGRQIAIRNIFVDGSSLVFHTINRNKESYAADLKDPEDLERVKKLIAQADVMTHNFRPGVMEKSA